MPFDFNLYSSLLLPAFIQGILFAVLLFFRGWRQGVKSDWLLGALLVINSIKLSSYMLGFAGWYDTHDSYTTFMFYFPFTNDLWTGPLLYFYFSSLTNTCFSFERKHVRHFILPLLWWILILFKFIIDFSFYRPFPEIEQYQYGTKGPLAELDKQVPMRILGYLSFFYYLYITLTSYKKYQLYVRENFSATEEISFGWLRNLLYAISAGVLIMLLFEITTLINNGLSFKEDWFAYLALGIVIYYLSIAGYFTRPVSLQHLHFIPGDNEDGKIVNPEPEVKQWKDKLLVHMETNRPYLEPDLTLSELAKQLQTNTSLLSKVINDGTGRNFNEFINYYRVQEVTKKMLSGEQETQTLLGIALDSGFNSKATFNRSFKKVTGRTPKEYIESIGNTVTGI